MEIPSMTQQEALAALGVTYKTLLRLERDQKVRAVRISKKTVRYYPSEIQAVKLTKKRR